MLGSDADVCADVVSRQTTAEEITAVIRSLVFNALFLHHILSV